MAPGVSAGYHQHFFCARLDLDIDGERNALLEVDSQPDPPGPANPHGQSFSVRETPLASELAAQRLIDPLSGAALARRQSARAATAWARRSPTSSCRARTSA